MTDLATPRTLRFKVTLVGSKPSIWRRFQVPDVTLDEFHEYLRVAMGWASRRLYQFDIDGKRYGVPEALDQGFDDAFQVIDSRRVLLGELFPRARKSANFAFDFDFAECWEHEVEFEGDLPADDPDRLPRLVEGAGACPPEDVGGIRGFAECLQALADLEHASHQRFYDLVGPFDPTRFDAKRITTAMRRLRRKDSSAPRSP